MIRTAAALVLSLACAHAHAAGGAPDPAIGTEGVAAVVDSTNDLNYVFARAADGKFIVVRNTPDNVIVMRRNADGTPDTTFGTGGEVAHARAAPTGSPMLIVPLAVKRVMFQGSRMLLAGEATSACGTPAIARLRADGSVDPDFGFRGWSSPVPASRGITSCNLGADFGIDDFRALPDGRLMLVARSFVRDASGPREGDHVAVRWSASGEHDAAYGTRGWVDGFPWSRQAGAARIFDDGAVTIVHGDVAAGGLRVTAARLSASGARSQAALPLPPGRPAAVPLAAVQGDGAIVLAQAASTEGTWLVNRFAGERLDAGYGAGGTATVAAGLVWALYATPDGGTLFLADSGDALGGRNEAIVFHKLDGAGRLEPSFGVAGRSELSTSVQSEFPQQAQLEADGYLAFYGYTTFRSGAEARHLFYFVRLQAVPDIVEFEHPGLRHYFITYDGAEARGIDAGAAGPGWMRTGLSFRPGGSAPVCRFYGTPGIGPNSHFYTADPDECAFVKKDPGWTYEGIAFHLTPATDGRCARGQRPVYRFYNQRAAQNDSNHRYLANEALASSMAALGWKLEGVVFCPPA